MITKKSVLYLSALALLLGSCARGTVSSNEVVPKLPKEQANQEEENFQRSSSEAIAVAQSFLGATGDLRSLSEAHFDLDFVAPPSKPQLRAADGSVVTPVDTPLFIINMPNEGGFFLVSGDTRMPDLLAVTEHGNLDKSNADVPPGLAVFLSRLPIYYENKLKAGKGIIPGDHIDPDDDGPYNPPHDSFSRFGEWLTDKELKPLVQTHWHQGTPFNDQALEIRGEHAAAGCVNIAFAQLIAFHRKPNSFRGLDLNWDLLTNPMAYPDHNKEYTTMVALLCRNLGDATGTSWGLASDGGSGAHESMIPKVLGREMGYTSPSKVEDYCSILVLSSLREQHPVPIVLSGFRENFSFGWWIFKIQIPYKGHTWLVDGFLDQKRLVEKISKETKKVVSSYWHHRTLIHCNWGWKYLSEGYYAPDVFNATSPVLRSDSDDGTRYYQYGLTCIRDIRP